ncbi:MAG: hypothetical protein J6A61_00205 [Clostridia bacterium]|nr:hypothetical protein [Clostridia bacterium]
MAEFDKNAMLSMLQGMLGEEKAREAGQLAESLLQQKPEGGGLPAVSSGKTSDELFDTAAMMQQVSGLFERFQQAKNTKEATLLSAIRPYLRASRQPKVDSCLKILQAYEVFHSMKQSGKSS